MKLMTCTWRKVSLRRLATGIAASGLVLAAAAAQAQTNNLDNPGAETGDYTGWTLYNNTTAAPVNFVTDNGSLAPVYDGSYDFKVFGNYNAGTGYITSGMTQTFGVTPGATISAGGEAYSLSTDYIGQGGNLCWLEVDFKDLNNNILAEYRSAMIGKDFASNDWQALPVTNQWNAAGTTNIGTIPSGNLVAPAGAVSVEFSENFSLNNYAGGSVFWDDFYLNSASPLGAYTPPPPPVITNMAPVTVLNNSNSFTFGAVSSDSTITNVQVIVSSYPFPSGTTTVVTNGLTSTNLSVAGLGTGSIDAKLALASNTIYTVTVQATDASGLVGTATANLDTVSPVFFWEASDFNYSSGQYAPGDEGVLEYANQVGVEGVDEHKNGGFNGSQPHYYRPNDPVSIQGAYPGDGYQDAFAQYDDTHPGASTNENTVEEEVGYVSQQDWVNYTRNFPSGTYNIYARFAETGNNGVAASMSQVTSDPTQPNQTTTQLGTFTITDNGWNNYVYVPLDDQYGNPVPVHLSGVETLRVTTIGNYNADSYFLVPAALPKTPTLVSDYPDGTHPFETTNRFTFTVGPANGSAIAASGIDLVLNGVDVTSQANLTAAGTNWTGSVAIATNAVYTAILSVTNSSHLSVVYTNTFDTFSQNNYELEFVDWDFNGGQFINNPIPTGDNTLIPQSVPEYANGEMETNSYYGYPEGNSANAEIPGTDVYFVPNSSQDQYYRPLEPVGTELNSDFIRNKFLAAREELNDPNIAPFDVGWFQGGDWLNYTREYPVGTYTVWARLAGGNGPFSGTFLSEVTSGLGTSDQTSNVLGSFSDATAAGWQVWHWVPMLNSNGQPAVVSFNGGTNTLKLTSGGNMNAEFLMLVPASSYVAPTPVRLSISASGGNVSISIPTQSGYSYTLVYKDALGSGAWSTNTVISGDGSVHTVTDTASGTARFYEVFAR